MCMNNSGASDIASEIYITQTILQEPSLGLKGNFILVLRYLFPLDQTVQKRDVDSVSPVIQVIHIFGLVDFCVEEHDGPVHDQPIADQVMHPLFVHLNTV